MDTKINYNYLEELNPQQRDAVSYSEGPALVIAGAGSGKTRVLTFKIVDLLAHGMEPYRILALTFTNKASREMKARISGVVGEKVASRLRMGTFHSVFLSILRQHAERLGFKNGFTIYDTADSKSLIKMIIKDLGLDEKVYKPSTILSIISNAKNRMITSDLYILDSDNLKADKYSKRPLTGRIFQLYCERCKTANAMDFDDILLFTNILLRDNPDIKRHYQDFFRYILVDEYQDTNFAQHLIISQLSGERQNIFLVGDDAQSIYSFRGANIDNILSLEKSFPGLRIFKLERNYRSTQNIVDAAGSLIEKNSRQMKKKVYSENDKGEKVKIMSAFSDLEEAFLIANMINNKKLTAHDSYEEYAILYRTNAQSRVIEESLRKRSIPYRIYGGLSFYQRKEVKDAIAYFRMSINPDDDEALRRIINYPARGIGETTLKKLSSAATSTGTSIWQVINNQDLKALGFNSGTINKIAGFRDLIQEFVEDNQKGSNAYELAQLIYNRTGILSLFAYDHTPESISRHENLTEILSGLKDFVTMSTETGETKINMQTYLSEVMLATDQDEDEDDKQPKVTLMTVHAAKGLEFKHVYIVGVEDELFPAALSKNSLAEYEEERRLLYVAITRAKSTCVMTHCKQRFRNGQTVFPHPSPFLQDLNPAFIDSGESSSVKATSPSVMSFSTPRNNSSYRGTSVSSGFRDNSRLKKVSEIYKSSIQPQHTADELDIGNVILHSKFGKGKITAISNVAGEPSITVDFKEVGIKRLLLRFAKFDILR